MEETTHYWYIAMLYDYGNYCNVYYKTTLPYFPSVAIRKDFAEHKGISWYQTIIINQIEISKEDYESGKD